MPLGRLIDAAADTGVDDFGFTDPTRGSILATRSALADARRRADDAAAQLGQRITGVVSTDLAPELGGGGFGVDDESGAGGRLEQASTRVLPGEQEFVVIVRVVYTAAPAT